VRLDVGFRRDEHARSVDQLPASIVGVHRLADADGEVEAFLDQTHVPIQQLEPHVERGVRLQERHERRDDVPSAEHHRQAQAHPTAWSVVAPHRALQLRVGAQHVARVSEERLAGVRQSQRARGAFDEGRAVALLQRRDPLARRRLLHAEVARGPGEALAFGETHEESKCLDAIHDDLPFWHECYAERGVVVPFAHE